MLLFLILLNNGIFLKNARAEQIVIDKIVQCPQEELMTYYTLGALHYFYPWQKFAPNPMDSNIIMEAWADSLIVRNKKTKEKLKIYDLSGLERWSPDGKKIAYTRTFREQLQYNGLWVWNIEKNEKKEVLGYNIQNYLWIDERKIICEFTDDMYKGKYFNMYLAIVDIENGDMIIIDSLISNCRYVDFHFSISPYKNMIVYSKPLKCTLWHEWTPIESELYIVNVDGTGKKQLTHTPDIVEEGVKWLPDGSLIVEQIKNPATDHSELKLVKIILKREEER